MRKVRKRRRSGHVRSVAKSLGLELDRSIWYHVDMHFRKVPSRRLEEAMVFVYRFASRIASIVYIANKSVV